MQSYEKRQTLAFKPNFKRLVKRVIRETGHVRQRPVPVIAAIDDARTLRRIERQRSISNPAHAWFLSGFNRKGRSKWSRAAELNGIIFDFWHSPRGIAVEIIGDERAGVRAAVDSDEFFRRSGIIVIYVPAFDEAARQSVIDRTKSEKPWLDRRREMGL